jgi:hypothetical protein
MPINYLILTFKKKQNRVYDNTDLMDLETMRFPLSMPNNDEFLYILEKYQENYDITIEYEKRTIGLFHPHFAPQNNYIYPR